MKALSQKHDLKHLRISLMGPITLLSISLSLFYLSRSAILF